MSHLHSMDCISMSDLVGVTFDTCEAKGDELVFKSSESLVILAHKQSCCESVTLIDVCGVLDSLCGSPLVVAEMRTQIGKSEWGTNTWTFVVFRTAKGDVTLRWFGESTGYYGEEVDVFIMAVKT